MRITIRVRPDAAKDLRYRQATTPAATEVFQRAAELGMVLEPVHPNVSDPRLASYYTAEVPDRATAERAIAYLQQCRAVEAAYIKPPDTMP